MLGWSEISQALHSAGIDGWQMGLIIAMMLAFFFGRPRARIVGVMAGNFAASFLLQGNLHMVMLADLLCIAILIGRGPVEDFISLLFALMIPLYIPAIIGVWTSGTSFAIVEVLTYTQYALIGGIGGGVINRYFRRRYERLRDLGIDTNWRYTASPDEVHFRAQAIKARVCRRGRK